MKELKHFSFTSTRDGGLGGVDIWIAEKILKNK